MHETSLPTHERPKQSKVSHRSSELIGSTFDATRDGLAVLYVTIRDRFRLHRMKTTTQRLDYAAVLPDAFAGMMQTRKYLSTSSLGRPLVELINLRVSQINGCAFCVDMHATDLRRSGETQVRLDQLAVWEESPFFSERERAALHWAESLTRLHETHAPDEDYELARAHFNERKLVELTLAISMINMWNRFGVGFRFMLNRLTR